MVTCASVQKEYDEKSKVVSEQYWAAGRAAGKKRKETWEELRPILEALHKELEAPLAEARLIRWRKNFTNNMDARMVEQVEQNYQRMVRTSAGSKPSRAEMKQNPWWGEHWKEIWWDLYDEQYSEAQKAKAKEKEVKEKK